MLQGPPRLRAPSMRSIESSIVLRFGSETAPVRCRLNRVGGETQRNRKKTWQVLTITFSPRSGHQWIIHLSTPDPSMTRLLVAAEIALTVLAKQAIAQVAPAEKSTPPARAHHAIFYDEARQRVLL